MTFTKEQHPKHCRNDQPGAVLCQFCGGDLNLRSTPEIVAAKRRLDDQATILPNWARQLLDYIAQLELKSLGRIYPYYQFTEEEKASGKVATYVDAHHDVEIVEWWDADGEFHRLVTRDGVTYIR